MLAETPPSELCAIAESRWREYQEKAAENAIDPPGLDPQELEELLGVWSCSDFITRSCISTPSLLVDLWCSGDLHQSYREHHYSKLVSSCLEGVSEEPELMAALRQVRRREMVRIAWRDIAGLAELEETTRDLSRFADVILDEALLLIHAWQARNLGVPTNSEGQEQSLIVVAMGKLGAFELNFSSDIDLIFTIPESGKTVGGRRERTSEEFFIRLGQRLIHVLNTPTADGFVFRVDMRLRPFGSSGPLVVTFDAMESYYQNHGRDWERYAWVKARISAGNRKAGNLLLETMRPFVYRRYLDYGAFESLREMKTLVAREVAKKGMEGDVKLGPGGIREVEFITQTFQLIRGGREPKLRERQLLAVLGSLAEDGYLEESTVKELSLAYRFLRDVEHRIQEIADQQTQSLPDTPEQQARIAYGMGHSDWDSFKGVLDQHRLNVQGHFNQVFSVSREKQQEHILASIWTVSSDSNHAATVLADIGFAHPTEVLTKLDKLRNSYNIRRMRQQGRRRLDRLMPLLLEAVAKTKHREQTLERLVNLIEAVAHRSVYLALLAEHPGVLSQLVKLCTASPWIAKHITRYPLLLDELLDAHSLYAPPARLDLEMELDQELEKLEKGDEEEELDALRLFKQTNILRVAAADVFGTLPLMQVSDHLTDIAEVLLCRTLEIAWQDITSRYGEPRYTLNGREQIAGFAIVAYGKLGGIELGYGSDLDIVFLHGSSGAGQMTNGKKSIDNQIFFSRLSRRLVHLLTTPTSAGTLYEVDFRLRPSGNSGMLVSSMDAFTEYQLHQAWTWEHQALVRARVVAGDPQLAGRFRKIRQDVLTQQCDQAELRKQVRKMRYRMREELRKSGPDQFDLKQDPGGIADIEFLVQYGVLSWTHQTPRISEYTDNIRILESFSTNNILSEGETSLLTDAYRAFRARTHVLALQEQPAVVDDREFRELRKGVTDIWDRLLEKP